MAAAPAFAAPDGGYQGNPRIVRTARDEGTFGLGVVLGEPTGFTAKYWLQNPSAIDFGLAFTFNNFFLIYADYLYHFPGVFGNQTQFISELTPYVGGGLVLFFVTNNTPGMNLSYFQSNQGSVGLALRIPLGIEWTPSQVPLGVFLEIAPGIGVVPATFGIVQAGIGVRYYFP